MKGPPIKSVKKVYLRRITVPCVAGEQYPASLDYECEEKEALIDVQWLGSDAIITLATVTVEPAIKLNPPTKGYEWTGLTLWPGSHSGLLVHLNAEQTYRVKIMEDGMFTIVPE